jgi:hypothetical protein
MTYFGAMDGCGKWVNCLLGGVVGVWRGPLNQDCADSRTRARHARGANKNSLASRHTTRRLLMSGVKSVLSYALICADVTSNQHNHEFEFDLA